MTLDELIEKLQEIKATFPASGSALVYSGGPKIVNADYGGGRVTLQRAPERLSW
jgi:hypothetical protein